MKSEKIVVAVLAFAFFAVANASADVKQTKLYKEAFPAETPKCIFCHIDKIPKKDEGKHELNAYGLKVKKENATPTAETYKKVGKFSQEKDVQK